MPQPDESQPDAVIEIPRLKHFHFGHGRQEIVNRKASLDTVERQIRKAQEWLVRERKYLADNCIGHSYQSTGDGDGSSQPWCRDCGTHK